MQADLTNPLFNLREVAKQILLLEDHLSHPYKHCEDCIRKHFLTCEALAEEASAMDVEGRYRAFCEQLAQAFRAWLIAWAQEPEKSSEIAQGLRGLRKKLMPVVFDPRVSVTKKVAWVYWTSKQGDCQHETGDTRSTHRANVQLEDRELD